MIEAVPVTTYLRIQRYAAEPVPLTRELIAACAAVFVVCVVATLLPLRLGLRRIESMEW
jgi:hypothetical protein